MPSHKPKQPQKPELGKPPKKKHELSPEEFRRLEEKQFNAIGPKKAIRQLVEMKNFPALEKLALEH